MRVRLRENKENIVARPLRRRQAGRQALQPNEWTSVFSIILLYCIVVQFFVRPFPLAVRQRTAIILNLALAYSRAFSFVPLSTYNNNKETPRPSHTHTHTVLSILTMLCTETWPISFPLSLCVAYQFKRKPFGILCVCLCMARPRHELLA